MTRYPDDDISAALEEKIQFYKDFLTATVLLKEALQNEEMAKVERLLADRESLAGKVDRMDHLMRRYAPEDQPRSAKDYDYMAELLKSIVAANEDCDVLAAYKCAELKKDIMSFRQKEAGLHGYFARPQRQPVFLNVKS